MDLARIDTTLAALRDRGDCTLKPSTAITTGFLSNPPHRVGIAHLMLKPRFLLADPVGCGKTPQALVAYAMLREKSVGLRLLVVAPKSAVLQWQKAIHKFLAKVTVSLVGFDAQDREGDAAGRQKTYRTDKADILITTYTALARDLETVLTTLDHFIVVFDEVQTVKSVKQKSLHPAALKVSHKARYVWGLSATPIANRLEELHAIMEVIRPGLFGSIRRFEDAYIKRRWIQPKHGGQGFWKVEGHQHLDQLLRIMRPFYLRRAASIIDAHLPEVVTQEVLLTMLPAQAVVYDKIVKDYFLPATPMKDGRAITRLASLTYAQQASDAPEVLGHEGVGSSKADELVRFLREAVHHEKVIVFTRYERVVSYVCRVLDHAGIPSVRITGKESAPQREAARIRFNDTTNSTHVIVLNAAGGQALDLQAASLVVFFDLPWSWGEFQQVLGRARRIGSKHPKVLAVLLANANTIDTFTLATLTRKESLVADTIGTDTNTLTRTEEEVVREEVVVVPESFVLSAFQAVKRSSSASYIDLSSCPAGRPYPVAKTPLPTPPPVPRSAPGRGVSPAGDPSRPVTKGRAR